MSKKKGKTPLCKILFLMRYPQQITIGQEKNFLLINLLLQEFFGKFSVYILLIDTYDDTV